MSRIRTEHGNFDLFEVISAVQKCIRRGKEKEAMFWALELVPRYHKYLLQRLCIIANEDIGMADRDVIRFVYEQRRFALEMVEEGKDGSFRLVLANIILSMCRAEKSRLADHFQCVVNQSRLRGKMTRDDVPDVALDKHTQRGRNEYGRSWEHWLEEGCKLEPVGDVEDPYKQRATVLWTEGYQDTSWFSRTRTNGREAAGKNKTGGSAEDSLPPGTTGDLFRDGEHLDNG